MQVENFLEISAQRHPEKTALICGDQRLSYRETDRKANQLAHLLIAEGIQRGDRIAICLENSPETVISIFAALKANGVFVVINPTTKADKLCYILNNSRAKILIVAAEKLAEIEPRLTNTPHLRSVVVQGESSDLEKSSSKRIVSLGTLSACFREDIGAPEKKAIDIDLAALVYTSGSTGRPKGVMETHLNIVSACTSITTYLKNTERDIIFNVLPLSFDYGLYQILMTFKIGGTAVLEQSMAYPFAMLERMVREKVTGFPIVPTILSLLFRLDLTKFDFSNLRYISNTGAALPVAHIRRLRELFPHVEIYSMYGLTECKRVGFLPPEWIDRRPNSVGKAMPNVEVYLVDGQNRRLGAGEVGELVVRGSNVMKGYWELPEETARVFRDGSLPGEKVLYTGDLFSMDEEGFLFFHGRRDDMIKSRGEKVSPKEVENILHELAGVAEAAVIGVPDPVLGQAVKAFVVPKDPTQLSATDILRHCSEHLEDFMVPKFVELLSEFPKNSSGKIDKHLLKTMEESAA